MPYGSTRRGGWLAAALLASGLAVWLAPAGADEGFESKITWHSDLAQARVLAKDGGKPLYVVFRCIP